MSRNAAILLALGLATGGIAHGLQDPKVTIADLARFTIGGGGDGVPRLRLALIDKDPALRAAAARVAHALSATVLVPEMRDALAQETDAPSARELAWALGDLDVTAASDAAFKAAMEKSGVRAMAVRGLVAGRGSRIVASWSGFRDSLDAEPMSVIRGLEDGLHDGPGNVLASFALRDGKEALFEALLAHENAGVQPGVAQTGLGANTARLRAASYTFLAERGLAPTAESFVPKPAESLEERLALHLFEAASSRPRTETTASIVSALGKDEPVRTSLRIRHEAIHASIRGLSAEEREALLSALGVEARRAREIRDRKFPPAGATGRYTGKAAVVRTLGGFPRGFVAAVMEATGCRGREGSFDGVDAEFQPGGRARSLTPLKTAFSAPGCSEAVAILGRTALAHAGDQRVSAILPERPEFLACLASADPFDSDARYQRESGDSAEPRKTRNVQPVYPAAAAERSSQGIVILELTLSASGCVSGIRVLRGVEAVMDLAAIDAVSGWRYEPVMRDGVAHPVVITATVSYVRH